MTIEGRAVEGGVNVLLSALGHDLRSPLNVIIGFSDLLLLLETFLDREMRGSMA